MSQTIGDSALTPLEQLEALSRLTMGDQAIEQPVVEQRQWRGFTFRVGEVNLVFPFMGGFEILPDREIQVIPWVQPWVRGITNVRGEIYSVVDFGMYLGLAAVRSMRSATLFMLPDIALRSAILLESRVNLKSFDENLEHADQADLPERLRKCTSASVVSENEVWHVVDIKALCREPSFISIGRAGGSPMQESEKSSDRYPAAGFGNAIS